MIRVFYNPVLKRHARRAFTYVELLAMLAIFAILLAIFIPYTMNLREQARQGRCQDNLRLIRDALLEYAKANHNDYPRTTYEPAVNADGYSAYTGAFASNPFSIGVSPSDVTASLWLLVREGYVTDLSIFVCPSTFRQPDHLRDAPATRRSNFRSPSNLSYSYANPFSGYADYRLNSDILPAQFAILADRNPGASAASVAYNAPPLELARGNSLNHHREGQNVLYADGSAEFRTTPYSGVGRATTSTAGDNIYTALAPKPLAGDQPYWAMNGYVGKQYGPSYQYDSYLVPTEDDGQ
jgi:type II secretory pathway pseudopilin PulG